MARRKQKPRRPRRRADAADAEDAADELGPPLRGVHARATARARRRRRSAPAWTLASSRRCSPASTARGRTSTLTPWNRWWRRFLPRLRHRALAQFGRRASSARAPVAALVRARGCFRSFLSRAVLGAASPRRAARFLRRRGSAPLAHLPRAQGRSAAARAAAIVKRLLQKVASHAPAPFACGSLMPPAASSTNPRTGTRCVNRARARTATTSRDSSTRTIPTTRTPPRRRRKRRGRRRGRTRRPTTTRTTTRKPALRSRIRTLKRFARAARTPPRRLRRRRVGTTCPKTRRGPRAGGRVVLVPSSPAVQQGSRRSVTFTSVVRRWRDRCSTSARASSTRAIPWRT